MINSGKLRIRIFSLLISVCMLLSLSAAFAANSYDFTLERDNNRFSHTDNNFLREGEKNKYHLSQENLKLLLLQCGTLNEKREIVKRMEEGWKGSCYGVACSMALLKNGIYKASDYQEDAACFYDYNAPINNLVVRDLINYYLLSWDVQTTRNKDVWVRFNESNTKNKSALNYLIKMAEYAEKYGKSFVLSYWTPKYAHSVLGVGYDDTNAAYSAVTLYDMNEQDEFLELRIAKNYINRINDADENNDVAEKDEIFMLKNGEDYLEAEIQKVAISSVPNCLCLLYLPYSNGLTLPVGGSGEPGIPDIVGSILSGQFAQLGIDCSKGPYKVELNYSGDNNATKTLNIATDSSCKGSLVDSEKILACERDITDAKYYNYYIDDVIDDATEGATGKLTPRSYEITPDGYDVIDISCTFQRDCDQKYSSLSANNAACVIVKDDLLTSAAAYGDEKNLSYNAYISTSGTNCDIFSIEGSDCNCVNFEYDGDGDIIISSDNMRDVKLTAHHNADKSVLTFDTDELEVCIRQYPEGGSSILRVYTGAPEFTTLLGQTAPVQPQKQEEKPSTPTNVPVTETSDSGGDFTALKIVALDPSVSRAAADLKSVTTSNIDVIYQSKDTLVVKAAGGESSLKIAETYDWAYLQQAGINRLTFETGGVKATISTQRTGALDMTVKNSGGVLTLESADGALTAELGIDMGTTRVTPAKLRLLTLVNGQWADSGKTLTVQKWGERYIVNTPPVAPGSYKLEILA